MALLSNGKLYAMGENMEGQCGVRKVFGVNNDRELFTPT